MKALTIKEPWASLIINEYKTYEFRSWKTNYRGKVLIHAGKGRDDINRFNNYNLDYSNGEIIGEAYITDCIKVDDNFKDKLLKENELVYKDVIVGTYAFKLEHIKKYNKKIPCNGKLSLWEYNA